MHFEHSPKVKDLQRRFVAFMREHIYPNEATFHRQIAEGDRWQPTAIVEELKPKARAAGLWNLFLPDSEYGAGLTNVEYAPLCEIMGRVSPFAPEVFTLPVTLRPVPPMTTSFVSPGFTRTETLWLSFMVPLSRSSNT